MGDLYWDFAKIRQSMNLAWGRSNLHRDLRATCQWGFGMCHDYKMIDGVWSSVPQSESCNGYNGLMTILQYWYTLQLLINMDMS